MARVRLNEVIEQAARNVTNPAGRFARNEHVNEIKRLLEHIQLSPLTQEELKHRQAAKLAEGFVRTRQPRSRTLRSSSMPTLYSDGSLLVLYEGERVWMQDATFDDLQIWNKIASERSQTVQSRQTDRDKYVQSRMAVWAGRNDIANLGELERHFFNYTEDHAIEADNLDDDDEA